ncbi:MAG: c-type cytochrome [Woeseia sp.]
MNLKFAAFALVATLLSSTASADGIVEGSADAGKDKSITCAACHGADGNSVNPAWPSIAGQHASYIVKQLQAFKRGERADPLMTGQAMMLSDEDMNNLAVYYSEQRPASRAVADASLVSKGEALYRGGDQESSASACIACHGPTGKGNPAASYPSIRGQYAVYTAKQLHDYASGTRKSDGVTRVMRDVAARLSDDDIKAVSAYVQGLRGGVTAGE